MIVLLIHVIGKDNYVCRNQPISFDSILTKVNIEKRKRKYTYT